MFHDIATQFFSHTTRALATALLCLSQAPSQYLFPQEFTSTQNYVVFTSITNFVGHDLWSTDGTPGNETLLFPMVPYASTLYTGLIPGATVAYAFMPNPSGPPTLVRTDGTVAGTQNLGRHEYPLPGWPVSGASRAITMGDHLYFVSATSTSSIPQTVMLADSFGVAGISQHSHATMLGKAGESAIWVADHYGIGTPTIMSSSVGAMAPIGPGGSGFFDLGVETPTTLYFTEAHRVRATNGQVVTTIFTSTGALGFPILLGTIGETVLFQADDVQGRGLFSFTPGAGSRAVTRYGSPNTIDRYSYRTAARLGRGLVFWATLSSAGLEPWFTDGTQVRMIADVNPGPIGSGFSGAAFHSVGSRRAYFPAQAQTGAPAGLYWTEGSRATRVSPMYHLSVGRELAQLPQFDGSSR